jgi:hypothetical protein
MNAINRVLMLAAASSPEYTPHRFGTQRLRSSFPVSAQVRPCATALRAAGYCWFNWKGSN